MRNKHNGGFSLVEVLVAIVLLGLIVIPICSSMLVAHRINAKAEALLQAELAVSSAAEKLYAGWRIREGSTEFIDFTKDGKTETYGGNHLSIIENAGTVTIKSTEFDEVQVIVFIGG